MRSPFDWPRGPFRSADGDGIAWDFTSGVLPSGVTFTRAGGGGRINSSGLYEWVGADVPRFDYDPVTLQPRGLLIEESRTNSYTYSRDFTNAVWVKEGSTITPLARLARDGTMGMSKLVMTATTGVHRLTRTNNMTAGTYYAISIDAAAGECGYMRMECGRGAPGTSYVVHFNLATGTVVLNEGDRCPTAQIFVENMGSGIRRYTIVVDALTTAVHAAYVYGIPTAASGNVWVGDGTSGIYIDFCDHQVGAYPTSSIPTVASPTTRAADICVMTGANFSRWFNPLEGTIVAEFSTITNGLNSSGTNAFNYVYDVDSAAEPTSNHILAVSAAYGSGVRAQTELAGVSQAALTSTATLGTSASLRQAYAYKANDFAGALNGAAVLTDASGSLPTPTRMAIGSQNAGANGHLNGHIRRILYYPRRLSNALLQEATT